MAIAQALVGTGTTTLYTSSGITATTVIYFMNNHTSTVVLQIHVVISGGSIADSNKIIKDLSIAAGDTYVMDTERLVLGAGDSIRATASVAAVVSATVSWVGM